MRSRDPHIYFHHNHTYSNRSQGGEPGYRTVTALSHESHPQVRYTTFLCPPPRPRPSLTLKLAMSFAYRSSMGCSISFPHTNARLGYQKHDRMMFIARVSMATLLAASAALPGQEGGRGGGMSVAE